MLFDQVAFLDMSISRSDRRSRSVEMQKGQKLLQNQLIKLQTLALAIGFKSIDFDCTEYQDYVHLVTS